MSEQNKGYEHFIPKDIKASPYSREKYDATEKDLKNLNIAHKIGPDSSDEEIQKFLEVRGGLENEKKAIVDQAWDEALEENGEINDKINLADNVFRGFRFDREILGPYLKKDLENTLSLSRMIASEKLSGNVLVEYFKSSGGMTHILSEIPEILKKPEDYKIFADRLEELINVIDQKIEEKEKNEAQQAIKSRIKEN